MIDFERPKTLQESLYKSVMGGDLEILLRYADRNSMAHSREVRLPFLNYQLAEFLFTLPSNFKIKNGITKFIMRSAFKSLLPIEILERKDKIGYEPPQQKWLQSEQIKAQLTAARHKLSKMKIYHSALTSKRTSDDKTASWQYLMLNYLFQ